MRWSTVAVLLVLLPVPGLAQDSPLLSDPEGDVEARAGEASLPAHPWESIDLVGLEWGEAPDHFTLQLDLVSLDPGREEVILLDQTSYYVHFTFGHEYYVAFFKSPFLGDVFYSASLYQQAPGGAAFIQSLDIIVDGAAGAISTAVPKQAVLDTDGKRPGMGDVIEGIHVTSGAGLRIFADGIPIPAAEATDRMPDTGEATWSVTHGIEQTGHIELSSPRPTRASNGEATTFIYDVTIENHQEEPDTVRLVAKGMPQNWVVTFPQERVRLEAGSIDVPVLVTVPFAHSHGTFQNVLVEAQSQSDPDALGRIELGVQYTAVPQPAGHHDTLWLHGSPAGMYLNTVEDHDGDSGEPDQTTGEFGGGTTSTYTWTVPLLPGLQMGLDFDLDRQGEIAITAEMPTGGLEARVTGDIAIQRGAEDFFFTGDDVVLATYASEATDLMPNGVHTFTAAVEPVTDADRVPWEPDTNLVLRVQLTATAPFGASLTPAAPQIHPGTAIRLPLNEYHDEVSGYFSTLSGIDLWAPGGQERLVNPSGTAVFEVSAENLADESATYDLRLTGTNAEWARLLGAQHLRLGPGETRQVHVAVAVPEGAVDGERADVTLHAERTDDPNVRSLVRLVVEVDTEAEHADDAALVAELQAAPSQASPVPAWLLAVGFALARRRGRA